MQQIYMGISKQISLSLGGHPQDSWMMADIKHTVSSNLVEGAMAILQKNTNIKTIHLV